MSTLSRYDVFPPAIWQNFEDLCWELWKAIWNDPHTQKNGRSGQPQSGVDIFGTVDGQLWGVQCKKKENREKNEVGEQELRREVASAKTFKPPLDGFILATTAPRDQKIQKVAREISKEHEANGLFPVHVYSWDEIVEGLDAHPDVFRKCYPDVVLKTIQGLQLPKEAMPAIQQALGIGVSFADAGAGSSGFALEQADGEPTDPKTLSPLGLKISTYRDLIKTAPRLALRELEGLQGDVEEDGSRRLKFRLLTNIGAAHLEMDNSEAAADCFIDAFSVCDGDQIGYRNHAVAFLLREDHEAALEAARVAVEREPEDPDSQSLLYQSRYAIYQVAGGTEPTIPSSVRNEPAAQAVLARFAIASRDLKKAIEYAEAAHRKCPKVLTYRALLGDARLREIFEGGGFILGVPFPDVAREKAEEVCRVLAPAWPDELVELTPTLRTIGTNLAAGLHLSGDSKAAEVILENICRFDADNSDARKTLAMIAIDQGRPLDEVLKHIKHLAVGVDSEIDLLAADCLIQGRDFADAGDHLAAVRDEELSDHQRIQAAVLRVDIASERGGPDAAQRLIDEMLEKEPRSIPALFAAAEAAILADDRSKALDLVEEVASLLPPNEDTGTLLRLADLFYELSEFHQAQGLYSIATNMQADTPILRRFIHCLFETNQRIRLSEVLNGLPRPVSDGRFYRRVAIGSALQAGDLGRAVSLSTEFIKDFPDDLEVQLNLTNAFERMGRAGDARSTLAGIGSSSGADSELRMHFAHTLARNGFGERAIHVAYDAITSDPESAQVNLGYANLVMHGDIPSSLISATVVEVETAVRLRGSGIPSDWMKIVPAGKPVHPRNEISAGQPLAKALLGHSSGETRRYQKNSFQKAEVEILEVKSKYLHALHQIVAEFQDRFPGAEGFERIDLEKSEGGGLDVQPLLIGADRRRTHVERAQALLQSGQLPVASFAQIVGASPLEVADDLTKPSGQGWISCLGSEIERTNAETLLNTKKRSFVVDAVTFRQLRRLGVSDAISSAIGPLVVTQSTLDLFFQEIGRLETAPPSGMIVKHDDGYALVEFSPADIQSRIDELRADWEWLKREARVSPAVGRRDFPSDVLNPGELMDISFSETMLLATNDNSALLCDDMCLRQLAAQLLDVDGVWIQPLLDFATKNGYLSHDQYHRALVEIANSGVRFCYVNADVIVGAMKDADWNANSDIKTLTGLLGLPKVDTSTATPVATAVIALIWQASIPIERRVRLTYSVLGGIRAYRDINLALTIIGALGFPRGHPSHTAAASWLAGHFLRLPS